MPSSSTSPVLTEWVQIILFIVNCFSTRQSINSVIYNLIILFTDKLHFTFDKKGISYKKLYDIASKPLQTILSFHERVKGDEQQELTPCELLCT